MKGLSGGGEFSIFAHVVLHALLAVFANGDIVVICPVVPCSFVHI